MVRSTSRPVGLSAASVVGLAESAGVNGTSPQPWTAVGVPLRSAIKVSETKLFGFCQEAKLRVVGIAPAAQLLGFVRNGICSAPLEQP